MSHLIWIYTVCLSGSTLFAYLDLHCFLAQFAFFLNLNFAGFFFQALFDTPFQHNGLFHNLKMEEFTSETEG